MNELAARAEAYGLIQTWADETKIDPALLKRLRKHLHMDPWRDLLRDLKELSGGTVRSICVSRVSIRGQKTKADSWSARFHRFGSVNAWRVAELCDGLEEDALITVSFGRTVHEALEGMRWRDGLLGHKPVHHRLVFPAMGDPLGKNADTACVSASKHAITLQSRFLTPEGVASKVSLEGVPPVLPSKGLNTPEKLAGAKIFVQNMRAYRRIFGPNPDAQPLIDQASLAIASVGHFGGSWKQYSNELIEEGAVSLQEIRRYAIGDFCGDLVGRPDSTDQTELQETRSLWLGANLEHYRSIAKRSSSGSGGTVVIALDGPEGETKADVLIECCRLRAVSHICCDETLAEKLSHRVTGIRKSGLWMGVPVALGPR